LRIYLGVIIAANLTWEFLHLPLYTIWTTGTLGEQVFAAAHCASGDILIALASLTLALVLAGERGWATDSCLRICRRPHGPAWSPYCIPLCADEMTKKLSRAHRTAGTANNDLCRVESPRCGTARAPGHFIGVMREHALACHAPIVSHPTTALAHNSLRPAPNQDHDSSARTSVG
jgi:hypothetical protein